MYSSFGWSGWAMLTAVAFSTFQTASAYRPVQHCKHIGDNGHYSACAAITQYYNATTGAADLYLRYHWYRYKESKNGWHAIALGERMAGAMMLLMYGDPHAPYGSMTVSVRTADGHHPVLPIKEFPQFDKYYIPQVDIISANFEEYTGPFFHETLKLKPTHVGITEAIIRNYVSWPGASIDNASTAQPMLWSSNYKQDFQGDYDVERNIDMHAFGLGFGFIWADLLNAETPVPMFGAIDELAGLKGVSELSAPATPTADELATGQSLINAYLATSPKIPVDEPGSTSNTATEDDSDPNKGSIPEPINPGDKGAMPPPINEGDGSSTPAPPDSTPDTPIQQPARTLLGKTLRDWMWHLHGLLMVFSFLVLYPLGVYLLRRPPASAAGSGFNSHWTIQALASVAMAVGALIGYINSRGISVTHQYVGIFLFFVIGAQIVLGWRHHVIYAATKQRTIFNKLHVYTGRVILPLGYINIVLGMLLRHYGWFTITLAVAGVALEAAFLVFVLRSARNERLDGGAIKMDSGRTRADEEEEYFQLAADDDDNLSESDGESGAAQQTQEDKRKQAERLARLDKV